MTIIALAFFVTVRTDPIDSGTNASGLGINIVVFNVPTKEKAEEWAKQYVQKNLIDKHPDQKLAELKVIPIHNTFFTQDGTEKIDWVTFPAKAESKYDDHPEDFLSSVGMRVHGEHAVQSKGNHAISSLKQQMGEEGKKINWDENKQFYYLVYSDSEAFVTRSVNILTAGMPFFKNFPHNSSANMLITVWPGAKQYTE